MKKNKDSYLKVVEWSKEDHCYVGTAPGLILGGVHGRNEKKVFAELCKVVSEVLSLLQKEGRPLPQATSHKKYSGKILLRLSPSWHKLLTLKAMQKGESINKLISSRLMASKI